MATVHDVEQLVARHREISDVGRPASDGLIEAAEQFLQVRFPNDYVAFLKRWGTLAIGPLEFYGITGNDFESSSILNAVWFTHTKRQQLGLPPNLVIVYDNNGVAYNCVDTNDAGASRIVSWDVASKTTEYERSRSLFDYIVSEVEDYV